MTSGQPIEADDVARIIVLTHGAMENGEPYWCYVSVRPNRYAEFKQTIKAAYNLQRFADDGYGEVIVSGKGGNPAEEVTQKVAQMLGIPAETFFTDTDIENTLAHGLEVLQKQQAKD